MSYYLADLYAGKIVAALDRQHPRDLFSTCANSSPMKASTTTNFVALSLVYLVSHDRPTAEVLAPTRKDIGHEFERGFQGMTATPVAIDALIAARDAVIDAMVAQMPEDHRRFLLRV